MARRQQKTAQKETASFFAQMYRLGNPPWDIGRAQPAFVELANAGEIGGSVLDLGCGTGDLVLEMTERGLEATGIDFVPEAVTQARAKARLRGLAAEARFLCGDALEVQELGETFDTVLDSGLFHCLSDPERTLYELEVSAITKPKAKLHLMVMSDWEDPAWGGPRRVSQQEVLDVFGARWRLDDIREARFLTRPGVNIRGHAWLVTLVRVKPQVRRSKPTGLPKSPVKVTATGKKGKGGSGGSGGGISATAPV